MFYPHAQCRQLPIVMRRSTHFRDRDHQALVGWQPQVEADSPIRSAETQHPGCWELPLRMRTVWAIWVPGDRTNIVRTGRSEKTCADGGKSFRRVYEV